MLHIEQQPGQLVRERSVDKLVNVRGQRVASWRKHREPERVGCWRRAWRHAGRKSTAALGLPLRCFDRCLIFSPFVFHFYLRNFSFLCIGLDYTLVKLLGRDASAHIRAHLGPVHGLQPLTASAQNQIKLFIVDLYQKIYFIHSLSNSNYIYLNIIAASSCNIAQRLAELDARVQ